MPWTPGFEVPYPDADGGTGGGAVDSVNGQIGVVVLGASDVGAQPLDGQLTDLSGLTPTKGRLIVGDGTNWTILGAGTDTHVLTLDSAVSLGVKWAAGGSTQTPWTSDIDADGNDLGDVGTIALGTASPSAGTMLTIGKVETGIVNSLRYGVRITDSYTWSSTSFTGAYGHSVETTFTGPSGGGFFVASGFQSVPTFAGTGAGSSFLYAGIFNCQVTSTGTSASVYGTRNISTISAGTTTTAYGVSAVVTNTGGTITTGISLDAESTGTIGTMIGLRITGLAGGTTKWGMQVGDYHSYHEGDLRIGAISASSTAVPLAKLDVIEPTIGDDVARFSSVATNDDVLERVIQARAATTDATVTTLHSITIPTSTTVMLVSYVTARRTGGASGAAEDGASYVRIGTFKNTAGTVAQVGTTSSTHTAESQAAWDCVFDVTGATARIRVTGASGNNVTWHSTTHVFPVAS